MKEDIFSPLELKIINRLADKTISISNLTKSVYGKAVAPLNASNTVAGAIRQINKKCERHKLKWFINGMGAGRSGKTVWKDKQ